MIKTKKTPIISWVLVLSWIIIIFLFSHQNGTESSEISQGILKFVLDIFDDILTPLVGKVDFGFLIRKFGHFFVFAFLGFLSANAFKNQGFDNLYYPALFCLLNALFDEFHQLFIEGRTGQLRDVAIDFLGSIVGILMYLLIRKIFIYFRNKRAIP